MEDISKPSKKDVIVLRLLENSEKELYGLEIIRRSGGSLKTGSIYISLSRMEAKGYIRSRREAEGESDSRNPRRLYKLTKLGKSLLAATDAFDNQIKKTL